jgi:CheY-like chemotaxis protein
MPGMECGMSQTLRILVCDDNVDGANALALWLQFEHHDVRVVHDGPAALEAARECPPDVVLMDLGLPASMDGVETARRLRRDVGLANALVVAVTGHGHEVDRLRTQEAGFDMHLVKPVEPEELLEALSHAKPQA